MSERRAPEEEAAALRIVDADGSARLDVFAKPRAKKSRVAGVREGALEVAIAAPPVEGAANEELRETLARALGVPLRTVTLVRGSTGKNKVVQVSELSAADVRARLFKVLARGRDEP